MPRRSAKSTSLPVDTNLDEVIGTLRTAADVDAFIASLPPPPKFDKKAWQREYMREYMRKRRAAKAKGDKK